MNIDDQNINDTPQLPEEHWQEPNDVVFTLQDELCVGDEFGHLVRFRLKHVEGDPNIRRSQDIVVTFELIFRDANERANDIQIKYEQWVRESIDASKPRTIIIPNNHQL